MSVDEPESNSKSSRRRKEKKCHSQHKKCSIRSQTSMSVDESSSERKTSRSKKQRQDRGKSKESKWSKRKQISNHDCNCIRKRKAHRKTKTKKKRKINHSLTTDNCFRCNCSETSMSSSKSTRKHFIREQNFDCKTSNKDKYSNSVSSELDCNFCEGCLSSLDLKINLDKHKSSEQDTCKCYSSSEVSSFVSQTDTSFGMSVDQEFKGHRKKHPQSDVGKKKQETKEIKSHGEKDVKKKHLADKTSVTCVCIYPGSDESPDMKTTRKNKINILPTKASNTDTKYKADADFCECFSDLVQPPTKEKTFKQIEKELKKTGMEKAKRKENNAPVITCKCSIMLDKNPPSEKSIKPVSVEYKDFRHEINFTSTRAVHSGEMEKVQYGTLDKLCCCETPKQMPSDNVQSSYFSSTIGNSNSFPPYDGTIRNRASCTDDTAKYTFSTPKSNSF